MAKGNRESMALYLLTQEKIVISDDPHPINATAHQPFFSFTGTGFTTSSDRSSTLDISGMDDTETAKVSKLDITVEGVAVDDSAIAYDDIDNLADMVSALDGLDEINVTESNGTITIESATAGTSGTLAVAGTAPGALVAGDSTLAAGNSY